MKWPWQREAKADYTLDALINRLESFYRTASGVTVTPETCMQSPTVKAIVTAVATRISVSPVRVMQKTIVDGREVKELKPNHPVARLLRKPNDWQSPTEYWLDATSALMRYGRYFAFKSRGNTGPILRLFPLPPGAITVEQDDETWEVSYRGNMASGQPRPFTAAEIHYARGPARDFLRGDSTVSDVRETIALEIAMEKHGAAFFGNGALPLLMFTLMEGYKGFATKEEEQQFIDSIKNKLAGGKKFSSFYAPKGIKAEAFEVDHEKSQFVEARKFQRTVIAGAFNVPPHRVGDLERATFNNVEQQDTDFAIDAVYPIARAFEAAMERDLLTEEDRRQGIVIRFNLDAVLRADFKSQQEGLRIMRDAGVISADDWRERVNMNPLPSGKGGDDYLRPANMMVAGEDPADGPDDGQETDDGTGTASDDT